MSVSQHVSEIKALAQDQGYPVLLERYNAIPLVFPQFTDVRNVPIVIGGEGQEMTPPAEYPDLPYGHTYATVSGLDDPQEIEHGTAFPSTGFEALWTPQAKMRKLALSMCLTSEHFGRRHWRDFVTAELTQMAAGWGSGFARKKDMIVADFLQKGTLSAGHAATFLNRYQGRNATDGLIYDSKAFFATDHPQKPGSATTYANLTVSAALTEDNWAAQRLLLEHTNAIDAKGKRFTVQPNTLITGSGPISDTAERLLRTDRKLGSNNNDVNLAEAGRSGFAHIKNPYLTDDADAWWVGERGKGLMVIDAGDPQMDVTYDSGTQSVLVQAWTYFLVMVTDWHFWACANKAAS